MSLMFFKKSALLSGLLFVPVLILAQSPISDPLPLPVAPSLVAPGPALGCAETANTWCPVTAATTALGTMLLLTDGRVMVEEANIGGGCGQAWMILTPASNGDYATGTWSTTASMSTPRLYFGSTVLPSGKVWVLGGEYSGSSCNETDTNTGEIYDPVANTWSPITTYPNANFGDDPSELLANGNIIAGDIGSPTPHIYNIVSNSWSAAGTKFYTDEASDEEGWAKLSNGNIVVYDLFHSINTNCTTACFAEEYNPSLGIGGTWTSISPGVNGTTGVLPALTNGLGCSSQSVAEYCYEMGPIMRLQDGRIFQIGANQHNALYNPTTNAWAAAPDTDGPTNAGCATGPCGYGADDAPAAELPTGHIIYAADSGPTIGKFDPPTYLFDFNPSTNTTVELSPQPPSLPSGNSIPAFITRTLMLPTGQLLFGTFSNQLYLYTPTTTTAAPPYRPIVQSISGSAGTYTLTGTQLNGQSAGAYYGDDVVTDENYPIVRLVSGSTTYYCKTTNWSLTGVGNGGSETVTFTVPIAALPGNYSLIVSGAGVQSVPVAFVNP